jgi:stage II sporulation protein D
MENRREILRVSKGDILFLDIQDNKIRLSDEEGIIGIFSSIHFRDVLLKGKFLLRSISPASRQRLYNGELKVGIEHGVFKLVNHIGFDHYLAGVVMAEAGPGAPEEFLKAQAVLCRTYAIKNWYRHIDEGFNLCDDTHCQAYHGIAAEYPLIMEAVLATHNIVVADRNYQLIAAAYHSNSGGETQKAANLWPGEHEYLLPIIDPFSENQPNSRWQESLDLEIWKAYLLARGIDVEEYQNDELLIKQNHRNLFFLLGEDSLRIPDIRTDLGFKSSFFSMALNGDTVIIDGKGYGHGIGLSQEGGMEMARQGYSYADILRYYYYDIQIRDLAELPESSVPSVFR